MDVSCKAQKSVWPVVARIHPPPECVWIKLIVFIFVCIISAREFCAKEICACLMGICSKSDQTFNSPLSQIDIRKCVHVYLITCSECLFVTVIVLHCKRIHIAVSLLWTLVQLIVANPNVICFLSKTIIIRTFLSGFIATPFNCRYLRVIFHSIYAREEFVSLQL